MLIRRILQKWPWSRNRCPSRGVLGAHSVVSQGVFFTLLVGGLVFVGGLALLAMPSSHGTNATAGARIICPTVPAGHTLQYGQTMPVMETQVPATLPCTGVEVNHDVVLLPPVSAPAMLTRDQAVAALIAAGDYHDGPGAAITGVLLAGMTVTDTLPPPTPAYYPGTHTPVRWASVKDRQVWLITVTSSKPVDVGSYGKPSNPHATPGPRLLMSHEHLALDARTGEFVFGFFTK